MRRLRNGDCSMCRDHPSDEAPPSGSHDKVCRHRILLRSRVGPTFLELQTPRTFASARDSRAPSVWSVSMVSATVKKQLGFASRDYLPLRLPAWLSLPGLPSILR